MNGVGNGHIHLVNPNERMMHFITGKDGRRYVSLVDLIEYLEVSADELRGTGATGTIALNRAIIDLKNINDNSGEETVVRTQGAET